MRVLMFVPGDSPRKFASAMAGAADTLILDLEDSVATPAKAAARDSVAAMLRSDRAGKRLIVRVNAADSGLMLDDLAAVMPARPDAIMLPKCAGPGDVARLGDYLSAFEAAFALPPGTTGILPIVTETAASVLSLSRYTPDPRLIGLLWGGEDLAADIGASSNRDGAAYSATFAMARNLCLLTATQIGVPAIDAVCPDISDADRLTAEATAARRDGFRGKAVIHPAQIAPVATAFQPTAAEGDWARRILAALAEAGQGVARLDGQMIDRPHERMARAILAAAP